MIGELKRYNSISRVEVAAAHAAVHEGVLSGFLGGEQRGGRWVRELEDKWCETFKVKNAVACNSATSGLLAAARAIGLGRNDLFLCPSMTMSATAAAPTFLGARPHFCDVEDQTFCIDRVGHVDKSPRAVFVTNLFGHPARLRKIREFCDELGWWMIEDNAQAPFAMEHGRYAGTVGHVGVWSLNVHKHIQCGEGGIITTDDDGIAERLRYFINHGELAEQPIGLNLRMNEVTAAIAFAQLARADILVGQRVEIAEAIIAAIGPIPKLRPPIVREGCKHVYYTIPFVLEPHYRRDEFIAALAAKGVPLVKGYVKPLYELKAFNGHMTYSPVAHRLHNNSLFYYENCAYDPTPLQIKDIGEAFRKVAEGMNL